VIGIEFAYQADRTGKLSESDLLSPITSSTKKGEIMKFFMVLISCLVITASTVYADEYAQRQHRIDKNLLLQSMETFPPDEEGGDITESVPDGCFGQRLPRSPKRPNYSVTDVYKNGGGDVLKMTFWRETCKNGLGTALLMRATPKAGAPFLCSVDFTVIQGGVQHNNIKLESTPGSMSWCSDLRIPTTFVVNEYEFGQRQFKPARAMTIIHDFMNTVKIKIPK
jgi:hypothetical protein